MEILILFGVSWQDLIKQFIYMNEIAKELIICEWNSPWGFELVLQFKSCCIQPKMVSTETIES